MANQLGAHPTTRKTEGRVVRGAIMAHEWRHRGAGWRHGVSTRGVVVAFSVVAPALYQP
ncbi:hypothetical protein [Streptomyces sp. NPDC059071]|uniref:hypothetical protein n=1 Tax=unclassified Streptomyces TaxID=2593676 RepID=UPI0036505067